MKRIYTKAPFNARPVLAVEEAFFQMPDTALRAELLALLRERKYDDASPKARAWLAERGLIEERT